MMLAAGPSITNLEKEIVSNMMANGWDNYNYIEKFEKRICKFP